MSALRGATGLTGTGPAGLAPSQEAPAGVRPMPAGDPEQVFFHLDFLRSLRLHRKLATGIFATTLLLAAAYLVKEWNSYTAQALVYVQPAPPRLMQNGPENRWPFDQNTYDSYIQQQIHNVTRPDVLMAAVQKIPGWQKSGENPQLGAARLGRSLEVARVGSGYQISITSRAKNADLAAEIANAAAGSFIESATRELRAGDTQRIELLREERDRIQKELASDRTEQDDLNKKLGVASIGASPMDPIDEQIGAVRAELVKARADNDEAAARLTTMGHGGTNSSAALDAEADEIVSADPGMVSMKTSLNARRSLLISQMANLTPSHPQYKQDSDELAQINSSLDAMTKELRAKAGAHIEQKLKNDLERTSSVEARLNGQLGQLTAEAGTAGPRLQRSNELATDIQRLQNRFAVVDEQFRNLALENSAPGAVYLSAAAVAPPGATRGLVLRNAFVVLLGGLLLGLGAALVAHNLDQRIYIAADVERVLGFSPMAQLPDFVEVGTGVEEEYMLRLAAALEHAYQQGALKSCIFTGVAPGAGATTVATRVTGMLEAMGRSTVLVDASASPGAAPPHDGASEGNGTEIVPALRGSRSTALLQQMAEEAGEDTIVLSDTAPLLVSGETEYLARFVDSAIVVIESGVTTRTQLRDVAHTLQRLDVSAVGFVLNRISLKKATSSFRDSVRAVDVHLSGQKRDREVGASEVRNSRREKKRAPKGGDTEPPQGKQRETAPEASSDFSRTITPEPLKVVEQKPPQAPQPVPVVETRAAVPQAPKATANPAVNRYVDRMVGGPFGERGEPEAIEEPAFATPLRGRSLRQTAPQPVPAVPVAPAPVIAEPLVAEAVQPPAMHVSEPAPDPVPAFVAAPPEAAPVQPVSAPEPRAVASANPAALAELALQTRSSAPEGDLRELPYSAASRLGGLRNLLVSLGLKSLNREAEFRTQEAAPAEPRYERVAERPVYAEPPTPMTTAASAPSSTGPASALVTAQPEFLPPKPLVEITEKEPEPDPRPVAAPRKNRRDSSDDVETLPSWRGQYRKKR